MITGKLTGDQTLLLKLRGMNIRIRDALRRAVTEAAVALTRYVKEEKLSGQVLHNRTGTLRRKINFSVHEDATSVTATVGVKLAYAAVHEYGFDGVVTVREHTRAIASRNVRGSIRGKSRAIASGVAFVRSYERHMHLPERSYLRSSLRENAGSIRDQLRAAVVQAVQ